MSGITGIVMTDISAEVDGSNLESMIRALNVGPSGTEKSLHLRSTGLGAQGSSCNKADVAGMVVHGRQCGLAFCGNLYGPQRFYSGKGPTGRVGEDLLNLYMEMGIGVLERLRGDFTLAVWDGREGTIYVVTDRFRVHPLFYYEDADRLVFGSRIASIRAGLPGKDLSINPDSIVDFMAHSAIPTPRSIFCEIKKLPPGSILIRRNGATKIVSYWDANFLKPDTLSEAELAKDLKNKLADAITCRADHDADRHTIGTFLSGGIDSSTVTGVLSQVTSGRIKCFSIGFQEQRFNELEFAEIAARHFGVAHFQYQVTPQDTIDAMSTVLSSFDEPFANASAVPTYYCAKLAKDHGVQVLYAGDGGDELFAGNERYRQQRLFEYYGYLPRWLRNYCLEPAVDTVASTIGLSLFVKAQKYIRRANIPYPQRLSSYQFLSVIQAGDLFHPDFSADLSRDPYEAITRHYLCAPAQDELDRQMYIDWKLALADVDIPKVMRMTEAAGIGVRFPFLDHKLAEFSNRVPASVRMRGRNLRSFFKSTYADLLPSAIVAKTKHGFGLPIPVWLRTYPPLNEMMHDLVLSSTSLQRGYFRRSMIEKIVRLHETDQTSFYGTVLWNLMVLEMWFRENKRTVCL